MVTNHAIILQSYLWITCIAAVFYVGAVITYDNARWLLPATPDHRGVQVRMEKKFVQFHSEVWQRQEEAAAKALKTARYEKPYMHIYSMVHYMAMTCKIVVEHYSTTGQYTHAV